MSRVPVRPRLTVAGLLVLMLAVLVGASSAMAHDHHHHHKPPHHPEPPHPPELPNLLHGGSFEHPAVQPGSSHPFASIRGWRLAYGPNFELQNRLVGPAAAGQQYAELDSDASTGISQRVHIRSACGQQDVPYSELQARLNAGSLPTLTVVVPDQSGSLLVVVTFDAGRRDNQVYTVLLGATARPGATIDTHLTHYSLLAYVEKLAGVPCLKDACTAPILAGAGL